ncbi:MAG: hypothetical protein JOZ58_15315 [Acetobacteraceae bacterium]|nr:hypothetical protein [Acetobacteraceae bacterium]
MASVAKAIRDRMTRGHAAECEKARLEYDDVAGGGGRAAAGDRVYIVIARLPVHSRSKEVGV